MSGFIEIGCFIFSGMFLRRMHLPGGASTILNKIALYISLPALVLLKVPQLPLSQDTVIIAIFPWLMMFFSAGAVLIVARRMNWSKAITGALMMTIPIGNTGFLGVPIIKTFFGEAGLPYLIVYDQVGTLLILVSYCSIVMAHYGEGSHEVNVPGMIRRVLVFPPMIAFLAGLALHSVKFPELVTQLLTLVAATLTPLVMLAIGLQLKLSLNPAIINPFAIGLSVKLLAAPLLAYAVCLVFGLHGPAYDITVMEAGMPPMITASAMAVNAKMDADLSVALAGLGLLCAFVTLPIIYLLL